MYKSDFLQEKSSFHPELLALNEREHLIEVILTNAANLLVSIFFGTVRVVESKYLYDKC